ncbi:MAG: DNA/RNA non-specific endonuclease [Prevotella sp.]|uniref:DNA/RNA non-specific endonuclease n=1 Tax=Prevotella sp. TaxID=59823 RepID=UPI002A2D88BD|nr:DNA/RNA non-specific endonuclease [Prevotella sp.]MDD7318499.1 DNA/RNA non-specific endonuclease [Prevotellaceae bacterium]MDY4020304.1 DNA/RNA non-specific endonuclease [Prevotella sp.]
MRKYIFALSLLIVSVGALAQRNKTPEYIKLKNGVVITFDKNETDRSVVVFGQEGAKDSLGIKIYMKDGSCRDYLYSQIEYVAFACQGGGQADYTNENKNAAADLAKNKEAWRLEFPRLHQGNDEVTYEITHYDNDGAVNFSLEWDGAKKGNRWTCYQLHDGNMKGNAVRKNKFKEDLKITNPDHRTTLAQYSATSSTYARGHLCPSDDRKCTQEQNNQTFYLSNMQPQVHGHNGGVWLSLEKKVRSYAASPECDTLYIVKAATIDKEADIETTTEAGLRVPKYFYMALLSYNKAADCYHALGVWSPNYAKSTTEFITIKELQKRTDIDFFCNLPDAVEDYVESDAGDDNARFWGITFYTGDTGE